MGMCTRAVGIRPGDDRYNQMRLIYDTCETAGVEVPDKVREYFNHERPDASGMVLVELKGATKLWTDSYSSGLEVDLTKLPPDVKVIRFINSW